MLKLFPYIIIYYVQLQKGYKTIWARYLFSMATSELKVRFKVTFI